MYYEFKKSFRINYLGAEVFFRGSSRNVLVNYEHASLVPDKEKRDFRFIKTIISEILCLVLGFNEVLFLYSQVVIKEIV